MVVGSVNIDLVLRVDRLPRPGETIVGGTFERRGGGKGANQAVAAARAGAKVHFVGAVGDDDLGERALTDLSEEGIDVSAIIRLPDSPTGVAAVVVDASGENQIAVASGANAKLDDVTVQEMLTSHDIPSDAVCLMNLEIPDAPIVAAAQWAHAAGLRAIVVNPAPARMLPEELGRLEERLVLTPNAGEAVALGGGVPGDDPKGAADELSRLTKGVVVVTLGAEGALMVGGHQRRHVAAPTIRAVDATGAGDAFNGALAAGLAQGFELPQAVERAVAAGSCSAQAQGARGGMPTREEIDRLVGWGGA